MAETISTRKAPEDLCLLMRGAIEGLWATLLHTPGVGTEEKARAFIAMAKTAVVALDRVLPTTQRHDLEVMNTRALVQAAAVSLAATLDGGSGARSVAGVTVEGLWEVARWSINAAMIGTEGVAEAGDVTV